MAKRRRARGAADPRIPDKQYFRIGEVAEIAGVEAYVLRFWETEFPSLAPAKGKSGRRTYSRRDVEEVLRIRDLLYESRFTIAGARKRLSASSAPEAGQISARTRAILDAVRKEAEELLRLVEE